MKKTWVKLISKREVMISREFFLRFRPTGKLEASKAESLELGD